MAMFSSFLVLLLFLLVGYLRFSLVIFLLLLVGCSSEFETVVSLDSTGVNAAGQTAASDSAVLSAIAAPVSTGGSSAVDSRSTPLAGGSESNTTVVSAATSSEPSYEPGSLVDAGVVRVLLVSTSGTIDDATISTIVELENMTQSTLDLTGFVVRYWFTLDSQSAHAEMICKSGSCGVAAAVVGAVSPARFRADSFAEYQFSSGLLPVPPAKQRVSFEINRSDFGHFDEGNDWSTPWGFTTGSVVSNVTVRRGGSLVWGTEP